MKSVLVGVDPAGSYRPALGIVKALKLELEKTVLACALEPVLPDGEPMVLSATHPLTELIYYQERQAEEELQQASEIARSLSNLTAFTMPGMPLRVLTESAKAHHADLIAVGSTGKGWMEGLFWGSVTRGLTVEGPCSLLVAKHLVDTESPLTLVMGYDGSAHSAKCLEKLAAWAPKGIGRLVIAGAVEMPAYEELEDASLPIERPGIEELKDQWQSSAQKLALKFKSFVPEVVVSVYEGDPIEVLNSLMGDEDGDLLVLGEGGHGFVERLLLGSNSMHFIVKENYNVLVLRP